ncbi:NADH-quinone oxidoreductase subunit NuoN [Haematospirillum jordaniae]|uniref:NADH-quinone oxidoreductase subunit N n=1 Tax=Haematospirillum jordaniae TaxID=1549855 RepID=A0A143DGI8_9PROT|nr:NADH-quinone oxidoreductase subunit NuoN [Haematospirillum jordaniae]AMW35238.1 NADH-quinone oxidoreductase subunit N [Haematospirillum jordaniae]NKD45606.1 NADH-quinone oxidoreductase subunit NuoN [Haematospirillum jordaniae]NKD56359.1 NADH-quinone oxidoreductase subunit NuoN [Haematospirillum jordaniae]NKD58417.1 NADH-quinone oxidoreductase subunit NuoN [Haematospirillum jordaniae]NKD66414.1 NADH-quinone oxidoreductase subunit NuoN [Haematospirillum jordaniae]
MTVIANLGVAAPELILACSGLALLMVGVFRRGDATLAVGWMAVLALLVTMAVVFVGEPRVMSTFNGMFVSDGFSRYAKLVTLFAAALTLILTLSWMAREQMEKFEVPVVMLFATLGMLMMISANNLMSLYLGLELMSLASYVLAALRRDTVKSTEAGLKYFVLGSVASGMLLYGMSMVYGFSGTTSFDALAKVLGEHAPTGAIVGLVFMLCGMAFKVSAVPFHMWTPDVYEGAPTPVTAFFAAAPKVAAIALFIRLLVGPFADLAGAWQQVLWLVSAGSMIVGAFGAVAQTNIKRLMAYSSIGHMGYVLVGLVTGTEVGVSAALLYMALYVFMSVGSFAVILSMRSGGQALEKISDLSGLHKASPGLAAALAIFLFSMAGIPFFAGFVAKLGLFIAALDGGQLALAIILALSSVVAAFYYIRVIKVMYFDEPSETFDPVPSSNTLILSGTAFFTTFFLAWPGPLIAQADLAAKALFPG